MNCEFFNKEEGICRIDGASCNAVAFCRLLGISMPYENKPFVSCLINSLTEKQSARLGKSIRKLLLKPALNR